MSEATAVSVKEAFTTRCAKSVACTCAFLHCSKASSACGVHGIGFLSFSLLLAVELFSGA